MPLLNPMIRQLHITRNSYQHPQHRAIVPGTALFSTLGYTVCTSMNDTGKTLIRGWVSSPDQRGTMDVIWSCIVTTFLCSWSVLFLNVSSKHGSRPYLSTKLSWAAFTIFFPEILATIAQNQWLSARQSVSEFNKLKKPGRLEWTLTHAFFGRYIEGTFLRYLSDMINT